jgi:hypothetical protein
MNRRAILAILTGGAGALSSRIGWAMNGGLGSSAQTRLRLQSDSTVSRKHKADRAAGGFPDLKMLGVDRQVRSIAHLRGAYRVTTADGAVDYFLEGDLRFKIDSSDLGPRRGKPVLVPAGGEGDRAWVVFASPRDVSSLTKEDGS